MQNRLILSLLLCCVSFNLFAVPSVSPGVVKSVAVQQNTGALNTSSSTNARTRRSHPRRAVPTVNQPSHYFYAGFGVSMLNDRGFTGLMPKAYIGYGVYFDKCKSIYGALEVFGGAGSIPLSPNQLYRVSNLFGVSIIPGFLITDGVILYSRLGYQSVKYTKLKFTKTGAVLGLGLDVYTSEHWDTRFEYNYGFNKDLNQYDFDLIYKFV